MKTNKLHVLVVIENALDVGGVQDVIMHMVRRLHEKVSFDIIVTNPKHGTYDEEFLKQGDIFVFPIRKKVNFVKMIHDAFKAYWSCQDIMKQKQYDAIYCCDMFNSSIFLKAASKMKVPVRISHSQIGSPKRIRAYSKVLYAIKRSVINKYSTKRLAVTKDSAKFLFGSTENVVIVQNPVISIDEYLDIRTERKDDSKIKLLHLGTLFERKNAKFSVGVLNELVQINPDYRLTIAGAGDAMYQKEVEELIRTLNLNNKIDFIPQFVDLKEALKSHDFLIMPSLTEGLPCVLLQAQAAGEACFVSSVVEDIADQGLCVFLPIEKGCKYWAKEIDDYYTQHGKERINVDMSQWDEVAICEDYYRLFKGK